jgi:type 1 glutamine amidotransferase
VRFTARRGKGGKEMIKMRSAMLTRTMLVVCMTCLLSGQAPAEDQWVVYDGFSGTGTGKHIVFVTGDEEYRSEEAMPQMAKILAKRHGFKCTVLFAINKETGEIHPDTTDNIPGLQALETADLMVIFTRSRNLPDDQMKYIVDYINSGKPIIGLRTATHAFRYSRDSTSPYKKYGRGAEGFEGAFGRQVIGEKWVDHWGDHGDESTRGVIVEGMQDHPIVRGCEDIWGPTDVYEVSTLHGDSKPLVMGRVLKGMTPDSPPNTEKRMMPVAWTKSYTGDTGKTARVFASTMGAAPDFESEGLRRLFVNACYWCLGMEDKIEARAKVDIVGEYKPTFFGFDKAKKGVKPSDHEMQARSE